MGADGAFTNRRATVGTALAGRGNQPFLCPRWRILLHRTRRPRVSFDLLDFYHNESRLFGVDTLKRDLTASAEVLDALAPGFEAGDYRPAPIAETCGLKHAQASYRKVAAGAPGRIVLRPQE